MRGPGRSYQFRPSGDARSRSVAEPSLTCDFPVEASMYVCVHLMIHCSWDPPRDVIICPRFRQPSPLSFLT